MSNTPRTDACWQIEWDVHKIDPRASPAEGMRQFCEELEREHAQALEALKETREALNAACDLAKRTAKHWDADEDMRVGKILIALGFRNAGYMPEIDRILTALAHADHVLALQKEHAK